MDHDSNAFKALKLPRLTTWQVISRFFFSLTSIKFARSISGLYPQSDLEGDGQQTGGVFVVGPGEDSEIQYKFLEGDHDVDQFADLKEVYKACGGNPEEITLPPQEDNKQASL